MLVNHLLEVKQQVSLSVPSACEEIRQNLNRGHNDTRNCVKMKRIKYKTLLLLTFFVEIKTELGKTYFLKVV